MKFLSSLFKPLTRAATAFFKHDLALRRADGAVHIVLEQRVAAAPTKPTREELVQRKESAELVVMRRQLAELLQSMPETRNAMRHLVFVEQALAKKGMKALHRLPLDVLQHALVQLEGLVTNWSPEGLANLRSKMAVSIIDREHMDPGAEADAYRTAVVLDQSPDAAAAPEAHVSADDAALAAAYAALGNLAPTASVELTGELSSRSAKAALRDAARSTGRDSEIQGQIKLRELQSS